MSEPAHTPTPWYLGGEVGNHRIFAQDRHATELAECWYGANGPDDTDRANAAFIVRAVNAHDELTNALRNFLQMYTQMVLSGDCGFWDPEIEPEVIAARAALSKAGAEQ